MELFSGVVENRNDPLKLGRCQVRIVGLHTDDKTVMPTEDLPWAYPMQPITSAAVSGLGNSPVGPVPGTWVVIMFRDPDTCQQPIMLGTVGGIPQTKSGERAMDDSSDSILPQDGVLVSSDGTPVTDSDGTPISTGTNQANNSAPPTPTPAAAAPVDVTKTSIPTTPPPKSGASSQASAGIQALINACDKVGLTTKYAKCALLGIAGGECKWVPQKESYSYNPTRLKQIFTDASTEVVEKYSYAPKKGLSREDFFSFFYGPTYRGKNFLGNKTDADGGTYHGRGFIQLTGRGNYERYQKLAQQNGLLIDIVNNPDSLDADLETSALIAALYIKDRVKGWDRLMYEPGFFQAAKNAVGKNTPDIALAKQQYYEYFLGGSVDPVPTDKNATSADANLTQDEINAAPANKREAYTEDRSGNSTQYGFTDPSGKYPLRGYMNESDTNRLARGIIDGTCFGFKDATRQQDIPAANGKSWSQPLSSYNTVYPYNKVFESESGHVMEFDDSPDGERVHIYHRKGTYREIDPNGSQTDFIVGDNYQIVIRNNNIYVVGTANLTVGGNINILCQGDARLEVEGRSYLTLKGDAEVGVAGDLDMTVGGNYQLKVGGDFSVQAENLTTKTTGYQIHDATGSLGMKSGDTVSINAAGNFNADYAEMQFANGLATVETVPEIELTPPELVNAVVAEFANLEPPERSFEDVAKFETPDEWQSPAGILEKQKQYETPAYKSPENTNGEAQEAVIPPVNNVPGKTIDTAPFYATTDFPSSYKLSKNFTVGHLIEPSVILRDCTIMGKLYTRQDLIANLAALATNICDPLYELLGPTSGKFAPMSSRGLWSINSGLRNGNTGSDHNVGRAIDFRYNPKRSFEETWKLAVEIEKILPYNQLILEYRKPGAQYNPGPGWMNWIHISYSMQGNKKQAFTMIDDVSVDSSGNAKAGSRGLFLFGGS